MDCLGQYTQAREKKEEEKKEKERKDLSDLACPFPPLLTMVAPSCLDCASYPPLVRHLVESGTACIIARRWEGSQATDRTDDYI